MRKRTGTGKTREKRKRIKLHELIRMEENEPNYTNLSPVINICRLLVCECVCMCVCSFFQETENKFTLNAAKWKGKKF